MKLSVSLPDNDIAFLESYAATYGLDSRSAVLQEAVRLLRTADLAGSYAAAWAEWVATGEADLWEAAGVQPG